FGGAIWDRADREIASLGVPERTPPTLPSLIRRFPFFPESNVSPLETEIDVQDLPRVSTQATGGLGKMTSFRKCAPNSNVMGYPSSGAFARACVAGTYHPTRHAAAFKAFLDSGASAGEKRRFTSWPVNAILPHGDHSKQRSVRTAPEQSKNAAAS